MDGVTLEADHYAPFANRLEGGTVGEMDREAHLRAAGVRFPGAFAVRSGRLDGIIVLADERTTVDGVLDARGFEAVSAIVQVAPDLPIVVLTGRDDSALGLRAVREGTPTELRVDARTGAVRHIVYHTNSEQDSIRQVALTAASFSSRFSQRLASRRSAAQLMHPRRVDCRLKKRFSATVRPAKTSLFSGT